MKVNKRKIAPLDLAKKYDMIDVLKKYMDQKGTEF